MINNSFYVIICLQILNNLMDKEKRVFMNSIDIKNWPECYYIEEDKTKRKELLLAHMTDGDNSLENDIRMQLWKLRYEPRDNASAEIDYFVKSFLKLMTESKISLNFLNKRNEVKRMNHIMENLGIVSSKWFSFEMFSDKSLINSLLYQEYQAFAAYYMHFSRKDSHYISGFMGSIHLKEEQIIEKLARDLKDSCIVTPKMFGLQDSFDLFKKGCFDAFYREYPQQRELLS